MRSLPIPRRYNPYNYAWEMQKAAYEDYKNK